MNLEFKECLERKKSGAISVLKKAEEFLKRAKEILNKIY